MRLNWSEMFGKNWLQPLLIVFIIWPELDNDLNDWLNSSFTAIRSASKGFIIDGSRSRNGVYRGAKSKFHYQRGFRNRRTGKAMGERIWTDGPLSESVEIMVSTPSCTNSQHITTSKIN